MAFAGSSSYILLFVFGLYNNLTLEPTYPGEDLFMASLGWLIFCLVTATAFVTSFCDDGLVPKS